MVKKLHSVRDILREVTSNCIMYKTQVPKFWVQLITCYSASLISSKVFVPEIQSILIGDFLWQKWIIPFASKDQKIKTN
jgi:hypothetical protein